jgi:hypothetical protein
MLISSPLKKIVNEKVTENYKYYCAVCKSFRPIHFLVNYFAFFNSFKISIKFLLMHFLLTLEPNADKAAQ